MYSYAIITCCIQLGTFQPWYEELLFTTSMDITQTQHFMELPIVISRYINEHFWYIKNTIPCNDTNFLDRIKSMNPKLVCIFTVKSTKGFPIMYNSSSVNFKKETSFQLSLNLLLAFKKIIPSQAETAGNPKNVACHQEILHALVHMLMTLEIKRVCKAIQWHQVNCYLWYNTCISCRSHPIIGFNYADIWYCSYMMSSTFSKY